MNLPKSGVDRRVRRRGQTVLHHVAPAGLDNEHVVHMVKSKAPAAGSPGYAFVGMGCVQGGARIAGAM